MNPGREDDGDVARSERAIQSLTDGSSASPKQIRDLFAVEFSRLERDAKVRKYLHVLATSNVRAMLSQTAEGQRTPSPRAAL